MRTLLCGLFPVVMAFIACASKTEGENSMLIKFKKTSFYFGESVPVEIDYWNRGPDKITIANPAKSFEIYMHVLDSTTLEDLNYTMGRIEVTVMDKAGDQYAKSVPPQEVIAIAPDSFTSFSTDPNERLYLHPGNFICYLTEGEKESNRVSISVKYQRESVVPLIQIARDSSMIYGRREWAADWLKKIYPGFQLDLPYDEDTPEVKKEKEKQITVKVAEFLSWWQENKDSPKLDTLLLQAETKF